MIIFYIIGVILNLLCIWLYKNTKLPAESLYNLPERPVLQIWSLSLCLIGTFIPCLSLALAFWLISSWIIGVSIGEFIPPFKMTKIQKFLTKRIG